MGKDIVVEDIYSFQRDNLDQDTCSEMVNQLPILYYPEEKKHRIQSNSDMCQDYIDSLVWTSHYYFKECINWKWSTKYERGPLLKDLHKYLSSVKSMDIQSDTQEYTIQEQLKFIFPKESHALHRHSIQSKEYRLIVDLHHFRYLWECPLIFELCE
jgi:5'-3' exonuclease